MVDLTEGQNSLLKSYKKITFAIENTLKLMTEEQALKFLEKLKEKISSLK